MARKTMKTMIKLRGGVKEHFSKTVPYRTIFMHMALSEISGRYLPATSSLRPFALGNENPGIKEILNLSGVVSRAKGRNSMIFYLRQVMERNENRALWRWNKL